jgi:signal transduction histidine kinase
VTTRLTFSDRWPPQLFDRTLTAVLVVVAVAESLVSSDRPAGVEALWAAAIGALTPLPVLLRRSHPFAGLVLSELAFALPHVFGSVDTLFVGGFLVLVLQVASCAEHARRPWDVLSLVTLAPLITVMVFFDPSAAPVQVYLFDLLVFGAGWAFGNLLRQLRTQNEALLAALMEAREADVLRTGAAIAAERSELARELHDVVAHCVTVMVLQAASARIQLDRAPAASRKAMEQVEQTGREALVELRRVLGLLRAEAEPDDDRRGMADLPELAAQLRSSGLDVRTTVDGSAVPLSPALERSAFRIIQEGLTNAAKHGVAGSTNVTVRYRPERLELVVENRTEPTEQPGESASARGFGLLGMRERVAAFGGTLSAAEDDGVFRLRAELPLEKSVT